MRLKTCLPGFLLINKFSNNKNANLSEIIFGNFIILYRILNPAAYLNSRNSFSARLPACWCDAVRYCTKREEGLRKRLKGLKCFPPNLPRWIPSYFQNLTRAQLGFIMAKHLFNVFDSLQLYKFIKLLNSLITSHPAPSPRLFIVSCDTNYFRLLCFIVVSSRIASCLSIQLVQKTSFKNVD